MMNENDDLLNEIMKWDSLINENEEFLEIAFFKIFVKFENFIIEMIMKYATGQESSKEYCPNRRLNFEDAKHLKDTLNTNYIDVSEKTEKLVSQIFDDSNPFSFFFSSEDSSFYNQLKCVRNFIAHESPESKEKYIKKALFNQPFIEPNEYLKKKYQNTSVKSKYTKFIELVTSYSDMILNMNQYTS